MKNSDDNVLIEVIAVLRSRRQDIRTVKLEDAKILTLQVIRKRRALANSGPPGHRPFRRVFRRQHSCHGMSVIVSAITSI